VVAANEYGDGRACPANVANAWCATEIASTTTLQYEYHPLRLLGWTSDAVHFEALLDEFIAIEDVSAVEDERRLTHVL
jgi:hypothetical protein